jgi:putative methylase
LTKKQLEILLSKLQLNPTPLVGLEQYTIPGDIAAQIINIAYLSGDIEGKHVADFGCGTGRLTIGCALMAAKDVVGIDIDEKVLKIASENVRIAERLTKNKIREKMKFLKNDVSDWEGKVDTVIQNPPFGIQKLHADRLFLKKALECGKKIYSLHRAYEKTREFLKKYIEVNDGKVEKIIKFKFRIPYMFRFHKKPFVSYDVDLFIISKV